MEEEFEFNEFDERRDSGIAYLETFTFDLVNSFEPSADKEIERLIEEIDALNLEYEKLKEINLEKKSEEEIMDFHLDCHYKLIDIDYVKEEVWALIEMKIIYVFKSLEINIKKLIRTAFSETNVRSFYKWDSLNTFLKGHNIDPSKLKGYLEVSQLKDVNNLLKHAGGFDKEIKRQIPEFNNKENVSFSDLNNFYSRIKDFPKVYLGELAYAIQKELYEFDQNKIMKMADEIALRMDRDDAELLMTEIKSRY